MAEYRRAEIVSGLFIVASVVVFALFAFKVKGMPDPVLRGRGRRVRGVVLGREGTRHRGAR